MPTPTRRRALVPRSAIIAGVVSIVLIGAAITAGVFWGRSRVVVVPDVTGLPREIAEQALQVSFLTPNVSGTRVSIDVPQGAVISQDPAPGTELKRGQEVTLVLSAGPQSFALPDLLGMQVDDARADLVARGLVVTVVGVSTEASAGVVVEMFPSPGATVNTGDLVRLSVPTGSEEVDMLLPYNLTGVRVVLDPATPQVDDAGDPALDVSRRLSALLQAAGATVTVTRTATETAPTPERRLESATASGAEILVGLDVGRSGVPGIFVAYAAAGGAPGESIPASQELAASITRAARLPGLVVLEPQESDDPVLVGFAAVGVRVIVGDLAAEADRARMTDPEWADSVARAVYRGVGTQLAVR
jgi:hypothetical protein